MTASPINPPAVARKLRAKVTRAGYLPTLDGWRAIAILAVLLCHGVTTLFSPGGRFPNARLMAFAYHGAYGVQIFFAISGFFITYRLLGEHKRDGSVDLTGFYVRRFFRILPPAWCYLSVILILQAAGVLHVETRSWIATLFMCKSFAADHTHWLSHFWSLSVEEQFYLLWPFLFCTVRPRRLLLVALCLGVAFTVVQQNFKPLGGFAGLLFGCSLALLSQGQQARVRLTSLLTTPVWFALVIACGLCIVGKLGRPEGRI